MEFIRHAKTITNVWAAAQVVLKKQIAILESNGDLSSIFEGLELKEIRLLDMIGRANLLKDLKSLLEFSLTRTIVFSSKKSSNGKETRTIFPLTIERFSIF